MVARHLLAETLVVELVALAVPGELERDHALDLEGRTRGVATGDGAATVLLHGDGQCTTLVWRVDLAVHHGAAEHHRVLAFSQLPQTLDVVLLVLDHALVADIARTEGYHQHGRARRVGRVMQRRLARRRRADLHDLDPLAEEGVELEVLALHEGVAARRVIVEFDHATGKVSDVVLGRRRERTRTLVLHLVDVKPVHELVAEREVCTRQIASRARDAVVEVRGGVVAELEHTHLRARTHDRLAGVREHELHGRHHVRHGVRATANDEAVDEVVKQTDRVADRHPVHPATIRRVDRFVVRWQPDHLDLLVEALDGQGLKQSLGVVRWHESSVSILLHADRTSVVEDHDHRKRLVEGRDLVPRALGQVLKLRE